MSNVPFFFTFFTIISILTLNYKWIATYFMYSVTYYSKIIQKKNESLFTKCDKENASNELRRRASELRAKSNAVPILFQYIFFLPRKESLKSVYDDLITLSNIVFNEDSSEKYKLIKNIEKTLEIK